MSNQIETATASALARAIKWLGNNTADAQSLQWTDEERLSTIEKLFCELEATFGGDRDDIHHGDDYWLNLARSSLYGSEAKVRSVNSRCQMMFLCLAHYDRTWNQYFGVPHGDSPVAA